MKIAVLGYYGFENLGDEAVLAGIRRGLLSDTRTANANLLVLSHQPDNTRLLHPGTDAVDRWKWRQVAEALRGTDLFILGGGSLLQDTTSTRSVLWYALMAMLAKKRVRRIIWWGQGIGPLQTKISRFLVRTIANQACVLTVRDESSQNLLKEIGVEKSITVVADPAFALEPDTYPLNPVPTSVLSLRHWKDDALGRAMGQEGFPKTVTGTDPLGIPMHLPEDATYMKPWFKAVASWATTYTTVEKTLSCFAQTELVIAMRLHALIFAARCATPFVALSYDPKVDALVRAAGQEDALLPVNSITRDALETTTATVRATAGERREKLADFAATQRMRALQTARIAAEIV